MGLLATIVNSSVNTAQVFAFLAIILGAVYTIWVLLLRSFPQAIFGAAFTFSFCALLWGLTG
jgi:hypothetical protein